MSSSCWDKSFSLRIQQWSNQRCHSYTGTLRPPKSQSLMKWKLQVCCALSVTSVRLFSIAIGWLSRCTLLCSQVSVFQTSATVNLKFSSAALELVCSQCSWGTNWKTILTPSPQLITTRILSSSVRNILDSILTVSWNPWLLMLTTSSNKQSQAATTWSSWMFATKWQARRVSPHQGISSLRSSSHNFKTFWPKMVFVPLTRWLRMRRRSKSFSNKLLRLKTAASIAASALKTWMKSSTWRRELSRVRRREQRCCRRMLR